MIRHIGRATRHERCYCLPINAEDRHRVRQSRLGWLAREILDYLRKHPGAEDTLEGVTEWWLLENRIRHTTAEVKTALEELVAAGLIEARQNPEGRGCYRANLATYGAPGPGEGVAEP